VAEHRGDPFHLELELEDLAAVAANYRRYGAQHLIVASVIEAAEPVARSMAALNTNSVLIADYSCMTKLRERVCHAGTPAILKILTGILSGSSFLPESLTARSETWY